MDGPSASLLLSSLKLLERSSVKTWGNLRKHFNSHVNHFRNPKNHALQFPTPAPVPI